MNARLASPSILAGLFASITLCACGSSGGDAGTPDGGAMDEAGGDATTPLDGGGTEGGVVGSSTCTVGSTGTAGVVIAGTLLLPAGPSKGELFIGSDGKIACAAASCSATAGYASATQISCPTGVVSPGLINAHDHTDYNHVAPIAHGTTRWTSRSGWRTGAGGETALKTPSYTDDNNTLVGAELRHVMGGTTSLLGSGGVVGLARNLAEYNLSAQLEGLSEPDVFFDTFPLGDQSGVEIASGCAYPKIRAASSAFGGGVEYAPHISEGISATSENELTCMLTPALGLVTNKTSAIHTVAVNAKDVAAIATAGASVIWSPRSNIDLYGDTMPITEMKQAGVSIALGTDWIISGSMNLLRELQCADSVNTTYFNHALSDQELVEMATINGAKAAGYGAQIGSLEVGKFGDVVIFEGATNAGYRAVIDAGVEDVLLVLRGGVALFGDAPLVAALKPGCGAIDVCGHGKQACIETPATQLSDVVTTTNAIYPFFFCKGTTPNLEPSCTPYRSTYAMGVTATDKDGDGVDDSTDDCPTVFNPIRPMDGTKQADQDGDGVGDACDTTPLGK